MWVLSSSVELEIKVVEVYVSIGSNIERERHIRSGVSALRALYGDIEVSTVYESVSVGFAGENFYNAVAKFNADDLTDVTRQLREIEARNGRVRGNVKFAPRTLDIDILLFGDADLRDRGLDIPRAEILRYAFVLRPLAEIAPNLSHPVLGRSILELWRGFELTQPDAAQALWPIELDLS